MDSIFGGNFQNEITWQNYAQTTSWEKLIDILLF